MEISVQNIKVLNISLVDKIATKETGDLYRLLGQVPGRIRGPAKTPKKTATMTH